MKKKIEDLNKEEIIATLDTLYTAASSVKGRDAIKMFLRDLLTPSERIMLGRRIIVARMLLSGSSYEDICTRLGVGKTTIGRVHRWLEDQYPGYEEAVKNMEKEFDRRAQKNKAMKDPFSMSALKRKYPIHFLLFPTPKIRHEYGMYPHKKKD